MGADEPDDLMSIGRFARLSGLSVHTLRHYDDVGLLSPALVDPANGYRRYRREQLERARHIQALRWIDLPIEQIQVVLADPDGDTARQLLRRHRRRLELARSRLSDRLADVDHYIEKGITMKPMTGIRPVQIKLRVDDLEAAIAFYRQAFGFHYGVTRRTEDAEFSGFAFGTYGEHDSFFLLHLMADPDQADRLGPTTFGLLVEDLDEAHARAVEAGGVEITKPHDAEGMPRCSAVKDPSGNWIWLYQG
jgi:DNA-binding transcriptional MerR regulator